MNNNLPTMEEFQTILNIANFSPEWSEPIFKCPKCDGGMCRNNKVVLASMPPKHKYRCNKCNHEVAL
ncbi:MAG: hypothetical protein MJZ34_07385 [Paludibacteraceae bacterium]|nr:hypothetical protein [Paludibacteraceae bacterium]